MTKGEQTIIAIDDTVKANGRVPPGTFSQRYRNPKGYRLLGHKESAEPVDTYSTTEEAMPPLPLNTTVGRGLCTPRAYGCQPPNATLTTSVAAWVGPVVRTSPTTLG